MEEEVDATLLNSIKDIDDGEVNKEEDRHRKWMAQGNWVANLRLVEVTKMKGNFWKNCGFSIKDRNYLYPEEALFLCEKKQFLVENEGKALGNRALYDLVLGCMSYPCYLAYVRLKVRYFFLVEGWVTLYSKGCEKAHGSYKL